MQEMETSPKKATKKGKQPKNDPNSKGKKSSKSNSAGENKPGCSTWGENESQTDGSQAQKGEMHIRE